MWTGKKEHWTSGSSSGTASTLLSDGARFCSSVKHSVFTDQCSLAPAVGGN